jgi:hypothetical protein
MMSKKILGAEMLLALLLVLGFKLSTTHTEGKLPSGNRQNIYKNRFVMSCSPDWNWLNTDSLGVTMKPLPGWGNYHWKITTGSDSALFYFNQGINMYYAFHIIESMASFKKAETFDNTNAMIYWGQALAYGPNINDFAYAATPDALAASQKATALSGSCTAKEKALINAMAARYSNDSSISRKELNQRYATGMKKMYLQFVNDADAGALYADALMLQHPWEYWQHNGQPQPWTPEIVAVLENVLARHPSHPGANHYYIHTVEASPDPGRALPSADRMGSLMPGVSHMVHMPSHIYIRTGYYDKGVSVNDLAVTGYEKYKVLYPDVINNAFLYIIHNYHLKAACAMMKPNYKLSLKAANECVASFDTAYLSLPHPLGNAVQYIYMTPYMVNVRYGKWNEIMAQPGISANYTFAFLLQKWARGMALVNMERLADAKTELAVLREKLGNPDLQIRMEPFNTPYEQSVVAEKILEGTIAEKENDLHKAIAFFSDAVTAEDKLIYTEPRDWLIPTRHYLAHALIKNKEFGRSKKFLLEDLKINPHNFYALSALELVAAKENNALEQLQYKKELNAAYTHSDMRYAGLIY